MEGAASFCGRGVGEEGLKASRGLTPAGVDPGATQGAEVAWVDPASIPGPGFAQHSVVRRPRVLD